MIQLQEAIVNSPIFSGGVSPHLLLPYYADNNVNMENYIEFRENEHCSIPILTKNTTELLKTINGINRSLVHIAEKLAWEGLRR